MQTTLDAMKKAYGEQINKEMAEQLQTIINQNKANITQLSNFKADNPTAIASTVATLSATKPAETEKIIKALPPLMITYAGKHYGDKKEVAMVNTSNELKIKNLEETQGYSWKLSDGTTGSSNPLNISFPNDKPTLTLEVSQGNRKMSVVVRKKPNVTLNQLTLIDYDTPSRKATANQTLYVIPTKGFSDIPFGKGVAFNRVKAEIETDPKDAKNNFVEKEPIWKLAFNGQNEVLDEYAGKKSFQIPLRDSVPNWEYSVEVNGASKRAMVEMVEYYKRKAQVVPTKFQNSLEATFKGFENINKLIKKFNPSGKTLEFKPKINISGTEFNEEVKESQFCRDVREGAVDAGVQAKLKVPMPAPFSFGIDVPYVGTLARVGAFCDFDIDFGVSGTLRWEKQTNETEFKNKNNNVSGKLAGGITFGLEAKILPDIEEVNLDVKGYGKSSLTGNVKYDISNNQLSSQVYFDPLIGGVSCKAKVWGKTVWDSKYEHQITPKYIIYDSKN